VRALARLAFDTLDARRVEIRMDDNNASSWRVAERAGFTLEALLRFDSATPAATRAARGSMRACAAPRSRWGRRSSVAAAGALVGDAVAGREAVDGVGDDAVDAERVEPSRLGRIVDGVDEAAHAGAVNGCQDRGIEQRVVRDDGDAAQRLGLVEPAGRSASRRSARGSCGAVSRAPCNAAGWNDVSSGGTVADDHSSAAVAATTRPVSSSLPGEGLISTSSAKSLRRQKRAIAAKLGTGSPA
jgi:hypothetical protein